MTVIVSFRLDDEQAVTLDELAKVAGASRGAYLRSVVDELLNDQATLNVARLNYITEYSHAALAALVAHFLSDKLTDVDAKAAAQLEQFHGQK